MSNNGYYRKKTVRIDKVHSNLEQQLIQITEDKLKLILNEHIKLIEKKNSWVAPLSILITLLLVFATTTFQKAIFSANTWEAVFIITTALVTLWLIKSAYIAYKSESTESLICKIKNTDE